MASGAAKRLTDRQRAVMERIDRRVPIKVIATELGVSETRITSISALLRTFTTPPALASWSRITVPRSAPKRPRRRRKTTPGQLRMELC